MLPHDCLCTVLSYLGIADVFNAEMTSRAFRQVVAESDFPEQYLLLHFLQEYRLALCSLHISSAVEILRYVRANLLSRKVHHLALEAVDVSSVDRCVEGPANVLSDSTCYFLSKQQPNIEGYVHQFYCGCAIDQPCYWSSSPSPHQDQQEFLTLTLLTPISLILGFSVMPYQAFFHPGAPIYNAQQVALQVLLPASMRPAAPPPDDILNLPDRYRHSPINLAMGVSYQSPWYAMENTRTTHRFYLPRMVACLGGQVRLLFKGMHQMQPAAFGENEYFLCVSHVEVLGLLLDRRELQVHEAEGSGRCGLIPRLDGQLRPGVETWLSNSEPMPAPVLLHA